MKWFSVSALLFLMVCFVNAQDIQNSSFEYWSTDTLFEQPDGYNTSNVWAYIGSGQPAVSKTTDSYSGEYAARLQTIGGEDDTVPGMLIIGNIGGQGISGGMPYNERPDSLKAYLKYETGSDTAGIFVAFIKQGETLGQINASFTGQMNNYFLFSQAVTWYSEETPDTLIAIISSSSLDYSIGTGSTFFVDSIFFTNTNIDLPNADFEDWSDIINEEPDDWTTMNVLSIFNDTVSVSKSDDAFDGDFAARIETVGFAPDEEEQLIGFMTNGYFGDENPGGGLGVNMNPYLVSGYYKYFPEQTDTAYAAAFTYLFDDEYDSSVLIEQQIVPLPPTDQYTYFELDFDYNGQPGVDTLNVTFASSNFDVIGSGNPFKGSVLVVDNLEIEYYPVGKDDFDEEALLGLYPNPFREEVNIEFQSEYSPEIVIHDLLGKEIRRIKPGSVKGHHKQIIWDGTNSEGRTIPDGLYIISLYSPNNHFAAKLIKESK